MSNGLAFTKEFEAEGRLRAVEILLTALINSHPDRTQLLAQITSLMDGEEALYNAAARAVPGDARPSALQAVNGRFEDVRDTVERIIRGTVGTGQPGS